MMLAEVDLKHMLDQDSVFISLLRLAILPAWCSRAAACFTWTGCSPGYAC